MVRTECVVPVLAMEEEEDEEEPAGARGSFLTDWLECEGRRAGVPFGEDMGGREGRMGSRVWVFKEEVDSSGASNGDCERRRALYWSWSSRLS